MDSIQALITPARGILEGDVAVTNNNDVAFEFDTDEETLGNSVPPGFTVVGVRVYPHDAADPKVAVSTKWRLRLYKRFAKGIEDVVYDLNWDYSAPASSEASLDITPWYYQNEDTVGSIYGNIGIENAANDATFTIAIEFERTH